MVEVLRQKRSRGGRIRAALMVGVFTPILLVANQVAAWASRTVPVTIATGESYTISDVSADSTPGVKVVSNPSALVVHTETPGKIVLLGNAAGTWDIDVTLGTGERITYAVDVKPSASAKANSEPPAAPPSSASSSKTGLSAPPVSIARADMGSGPIDSSSSFSGAPTGSSSGDVHKSASGVASKTESPAAVGIESVKLASAARETSGAAKFSEAHSVTAPPTSIAEASVPSSTGATAASAAPPIVAPNSTSGDNGMLPDGSSQTASGAASAAARTYNTDPMAVIPTAPPPLGKKHYMPGEGVDLMSGTSQVLDYPSRIRRVSVADSKVADIQVINPYQLNLVAHQPGFTTLAVWDTQGRYSERQIKVDESGKQQVLLNVIVAELNRSRVENFGVNWTAALPRWDISLVNMAGGVATPYNATSALTSNALISSNPPVTVSNSAAGTLPAQGTLIPLLLSQNMTYGLAAGNGNIQTQSFFQFLEENSMGKILAEPHLLANSGEKAEFLSGGEIPIVISQALNTSIVFKQFGTSIIFVPTVIGFDDIMLKVKPEVSEPDFAHGVNLFGFTVPAFVTRKAETLVRLKNNQTLIIAGLLLNTKNETVAKVPYLGDIPYVRGLFRNTSYSNTQTDLVMTVTPQIVAPLPGNGQVALPTDRGPMNFEEIKTRRVYPEDAGRPRF
jgi:Flp pilus assembly secretin CpaC